MTASNGNFWSISPRKSLEAQQKHALRNRFLQTLLCLNDIFNPGYNQKVFMRRKKHAILTEFVLVMNSCFIQYKAVPKENFNVAQDVNAISRMLFVFSEI